jgi:hypothetical protein
VDRRRSRPRFSDHGIAAFDVLFLSPTRNGEA